METQKRVAAIHDISCFGKCSLTVVLPILSAMGIETSILPTAILSTHTGGFTDFTYRDLTAELMPIIEHWHQLGIKFDAVFSGYLGSFEQLAIVEKIVDLYREKDTLVMIDPVMADQGELYENFTPSFVEGMKHLCSRADIIVPNMTEACLLLGIPYGQGPHEKREIEQILKGLSNLGPEKIVLTGVWIDDEKYGTAAYDHGIDQVSYAFSKKVPGIYYGTGDIFASVVLGALLSNKTLGQAIGQAVGFTSDCIQRTYEAGTDTRYGVNFEMGLKELTRR